jgi:hypothetical protein
MTHALHRYWFEFEAQDERDMRSEIRLGCGVTAYSVDDAAALLGERVFKSGLPKIRRVIEDVDVSKLDAGHVRPNMAPPNWRGIWFPMGYANPTR